MRPTESSEAKTSRIAEKVVIIGGLILLLALYVSYRNLQSKLKKDGVYVIGKVVKRSGEKNGINSRIEYRFNERAFKYSWKAVSSIKETFVFLIISKERPKVCSLLLQSKVPKCLSNDSSMLKYWEEIPQCP